MSSSSREDTREIPNTYEEYTDNIKIVNEDTGRLEEQTEDAILNNAFVLLGALEKHLTTEIDWSDHSVYTGTPGYALICLRFNDIKLCEGQKDYLKMALSYIEPILPRLKRRRYSFMCGVAGPLAIGSVIFHKMGLQDESDDLAQRMENLSDDVIPFKGDFPDEVLYGRAGYLYALLFLQKHLGKTSHRESLIKEVISSILMSGKYQAKKAKNTIKSPLFFEWHEKPYIGAAHGITGILYMLLQAYDYLDTEDLNELIKPSVEAMLDLQFPSGNFPSSLGNNTDKLVHWCHGAPGVIHLLMLAYVKFSDEKYLTAAKKCSDVIWERGLLKKGYGLCHGSSGNGYAHLRIFQVTREEKYLYRAVKFAMWCSEYGKHGCRTPDRPLSLFEGLGAAVYYLVDMLEPENSAFPAFQL